MYCNKWIAKSQGSSNLEIREVSLQSEVHILVNWHTGELCQQQWNHALHNSEHSEHVFSAARLTLTTLPPPLTRKNNRTIHHTGICSHYHPS
jgi:hypothetical protein